MKKWRQLELLVARIERAVSPFRAEVRSPDRIPDVRTGQLREVDVSIRYRVGTTPILITVECRRRRRAEDVTWIEQLSAKKTSIGAARTVAVSVTGFSEAALECARLSGIEARTLKDIDETDVRSWLNVGTVVLHVGRSELKAFKSTLLLRPGESEAEMDPEARAAFRADPSNAMVFSWCATGERFSLNTIFPRITKSHPGWLAGVPDDGRRVSRRVQVDFPAGEVSVKTIDGPRWVGALQLHYDVYFTTIKVSLDRRRRYSYESDADQLVQHTEYSAPTGLGGELSMVLTRDLKTDLLQISIKRSDLEAIGRDLMNKGRTGSDGTDDVQSV